MSQNSTPNYSYVNPPPNRFQAVYLQYNQPSEGYGYQINELNPPPKEHKPRAKHHREHGGGSKSSKDQMANLKHSKEQMANLKASKDQMGNMKYSSPPVYPVGMGESNDGQKQFRIPKVTNEDVQKILVENYNIIKSINDSIDSPDNPMDDPEFTLKFGTLHKNIVFLSRISDQPPN